MARPGFFYCPACDDLVEAKCPKEHPFLIVGVTVDLVVEHEGRIALVERINRKDPSGPGTWALPGGFLEYSETLESAATREAMEELGATEVTLLSQLQTYGDPTRDGERRNVSVVFVATVDKVLSFNQRTEREQKALLKEGIKNVQLVSFSEKLKLGFDHDAILADYLQFRDRLLPLARRYAR